MAEINSFLKIWSKKINDFYSFFPKTKLNFVFTSDGNSVADKLSNIKGIINSRVDDIDSYNISKGYLTDMQITSQLKDKLNGLFIRNNVDVAGALQIYKDGTWVDWFSGLNFIKNNDKIYSTYEELGTTVTSGLENVRTATEEYENIYVNNSNNSINLNLEATVPIKGGTMTTYDRKMLLKSHYPVGYRDDINFSVNIDDEGIYGNTIMLPYGFSFGGAVVYNNEIHILGSSIQKCQRYHYKYDGTAWTSVSTLPLSTTVASNNYYLKTLVYNNEIHLFDMNANNFYTAHYKWDGITWTSIGNLLSGSTPIYPSDLVVMGDKIYALQEKYLFSWDGTEWTLESSAFSSNVFSSKLAVYNNEIHIFGGSNSSNGVILNTHYKWSNNRVISVSTLPYSGTIGDVVVYNDKLHILGGTDMSNIYNYHYIWDGSEWVTSTEVLPYQFYGGCAVVYNDEIHLMGSHYTSNNTTSWYKYNDTDGWDLIVSKDYELWFGYRLADDKSKMKRLVAKELYQNDDFVKMFRIETSGSYSFNLYDYCSNNGITVPSSNAYLCFYLDIGFLKKIVVTPENAYEPLYITASINIE